MTTNTATKTKSNGNPRSRPAADPANDPSLALLPCLEQLPPELPRKGITVALHRSLLKPHPENPQVMDPYASQGLRDSLKFTDGMVQDPIWNRRNGMLVGGHHRIEQEDKRHGTQDYWVSVKVVDWDEKTHCEAMVLLNNGNIQGQVDVALLDDLLRKPEFDFRNAGFNQVNLEELYLSNGLTLDLPGLGLSENEVPVDPGRREAEDAADDIADQLDEADAAKAAQRGRTGPRGTDDRNNVDAIRQRREEYQQQAAYRGQEDVRVELVFPTEELKQEFMKFLQKPLAAERIDGVELVRFLGLDIPVFAEPVTSGS